jgi:hypothetical protein
MIVRMQKGRSFHGAQLYYLHDKKAKHELLRLSTDRVAWIETHNCASNVPEVAFSEMIAVAQFQNELKLEAGHTLAGNKCEEPVLTVSLSWRPHVDKPTREHMLETAQDFMNKIGLTEHQAVILAHNDTAHQHVHLVINRINPGTGLVHDESFSKNRAMRWREGYEREHGIIRDTDRAAEKYQHKHHDFALDAREIQNRYAELEAIATRSIGQQEKDQLAQQHQQEREAFLESRHAQFREAREQAYRETHAEFRPRWVEHYARNDHSPEYLQERRALRAEQREETRQRQDEACADLYDQRAEEFTAIKLRQKEERGELKQLQAARDEGQPYDQERLAELTSERAPGLTQPYRSFASAMEGAVHSSDVKAKEGDTAHILSPTEQREARQQIEHEAEHATGPNEKAPHRDGFDGLAGGIGKIAEIASDILGNIFAPPTPQERAHEHAKAAAREEAEPERQAAEAKATDDRARSAEEQIRAYFEQNAERIAHEDAERRAKDRRERER